MRDTIEQLICDWTKIGAAFGADPSPTSPDLERLLISTVQCAPKMARLFVIATTWLHVYGDVVAKHRLRKLIREELSGDEQSIMGLMLDLAHDRAHPQRFASIIRDLKPSPLPRPLFEVDRTSQHMIERSRTRACAVSRRWGCWCEPFEMKLDALRPAVWVMSNNAFMIVRADFRGDLRASILAALTHNEHAGASELELARQSGGSRAQIRNALDNLEMTGKARRLRSTDDRRVRILLGSS
jgi:hypothetical protein